MRAAFVFPGQGSQSVGMGKELAEAFPLARETFEEVDEALKQRLSSLMFEGPEAELTLTENAQPALMAVSQAVFRVLCQQGNWTLADKAMIVAGHSLGEYSALAAAGTLDLATAAKLLKIRGQAMQQAVPVGIGAMAALLGLEMAEAQDIATAAARETGKICACANDNAPGQVVVSGHKEAVERAIGLAGERGAKRSVLLPVSAPFHCALMKPAAEKMAEALAGTNLRSPAIPVIANVTAEPVREADSIRGLLVEQVTATVRWRESMLKLKTLGVEKVCELGAGKVLAGLMKRIDKDIPAYSAGRPAEIDELLKILG